MLLYPGAMLAGAPPAFFLVFAGVFTDAGSVWERALSLALVAVAYGLLGLVFASFEPDGGAYWGIWIASPAVALLVTYAVREPSTLVLDATYLAVALGAAMGAATAMSRHRLARRASR